MPEIGEGKSGHPTRRGFIAVVSAADVDGASGYHSLRLSIG